MSADIDDTARLLLMERESRGHKWSVRRFADLVREQHPKATAHDITHLWAKYMGVDRVRATHDYETGARL